mmetsp:Transcript_1683/g.3576  ORF Transcript_1683/g.3576 Transcript_1683/m.3576 type:complete len:797 (-) Transcript_1683:23-2413(-)
MAQWPFGGRDSTENSVGVQTSIDHDKIAKLRFHLESLFLLIHGGMGLLGAFGLDIESGVPFLLEEMSSHLIAIDAFRRTSLPTLNKRRFDESDNMFLEMKMEIQQKLKALAESKGIVSQTDGVDQQVLAKSKANHIVDQQHQSSTDLDCDSFRSLPLTSLGEEVGTIDDCDDVDNALRRKLFYEDQGDVESPSGMVSPAGSSEEELQTDDPSSDLDESLCEPSNAASSPCSDNEQEEGDGAEDDVWSQNDVAAVEEEVGRAASNEDFSESRGSIVTRRNLTTSTPVDENRSLVSASLSSEEFPSLGPSPSLMPERFEVVQGLNDNAAKVSTHIDEIRAANCAFVKDLEILNPIGDGESCYLYGRFDTCTPMIDYILSTLKNGGDLKAVLTYIRDYGMVLAPNMTIFEDIQMQMRNRAARMEREANEIRIADVNGPASLVAKSFADKEVKDGSNNGDVEDTVVLTPREAAALAAFNTFTHRQHDLIPKSCAVINQKVKNHSSLLMCLLIAVRVADRIKLSEVSERVKKPSDERTQNLKLLIILAQTIKPDLSEASIFGMTIYQYCVDVLYPSLELSLDQLFETISVDPDVCQSLVSIIIQLTSFLKDEMNAQKYIEGYKRAECISMVENMDDLHSDEIKRRNDEMEDEDYYFCEKNKGKLQTFRRKPCSAILFSLINAQLLGKTLVPCGLCESTIDLIVFGILCNAPTNFSMKNQQTKRIPLAFLFNENNYFQNEHESDETIDKMKLLVDGNIKPVLDTAMTAMKEFKKETHFADYSDLTHFTKYHEKFIQPNCAST